MLYFFVGLFGTSVIIIICFFLLPKTSQRQAVEFIRRVRHGKQLDVKE